MNSNNETLFWKKKEFISFVLSILVFFIHSYFAQEYTSGNALSFLNHKVSFFFSRSITQFAVPMFFMLSGLAFFKGYSPAKYAAKIKSRVFTLVIPYVLWNTVWLLWELLCSYSFLAKFSAASEPYPLTVPSILKGIFFHGCNTPFWFMFNLIVFSFAAPLVFLLIKNKYVALGSIAVLSVLSLFGIHLPISVFYYPNSLVFFLIGATVGYHYFDWACQRSSKKVQLASLIFLLTYVLVKTVIPQALHVRNYLIEIVIFTLCAFSLWCITDGFIEKLKPRAIYRRSFAIYAMHLNIALIVLKLLSIALPQNEWLAIPKFVIMVPVTLLIINGVCAFLERFLPQLYALLFGGRLKKSQ